MEKVHRLSKSKGVEINKRSSSFALALTFRTGKNQFENLSLTENL